MDLTPDERRLIEQSRAQSAIQHRPVDKVDVLRNVLRSMRALAAIGKQMDTIDPIWDQLLDIIPEAGP